jgi:protein CpxP
MNQKKYKWLFFLLFVLLVSNIVLAVFLFVSNSSKDGKQNKNEANSIYKEIGLDSIQIDTFKARKEAYFKVMRPLWNEIKELKDSMYKKLEADSNDLIVRSLSSEIANKTSIADMKTYQHFSELRKLCTPDQQVRYDTIIPKLVNRRNRR